jgi:hypothetical protein
MVLTVAGLAFSISPKALATAQPDLAAIEKLRFLTGAWACTIAGGTSDGLMLQVEYSFSPDGLWMIEVSKDADTKGGDWQTQLWGYDRRSDKLVAYSFASDGVSTKTVDGWIDGVFRSQRDDNGATVSLRSLGKRSMQWRIESRDHSLIVEQNCMHR